MVGTNEERSYLWKVIYRSILKKFNGYVREGE